MKLGKEKILDAAFTLLDEEGLEKFNLRALAKRLDVSATALYWHFSDKDELIKAMTQRIYGLAYDVLKDEDNLSSALLAFGHALHKAFGATRGTARLIASAKPIEVEVSAILSNKSKPLVQLGASLEDAYIYEASIISYVLGWSIFDQNQSMHAYLEQLMDFENTFEIGLRAMVKGLIDA